MASPPAWCAKAEDDPQPPIPHKKEKGSLGHASRPFVGEVRWCGHAPNSAQSEEDRRMTMVIPFPYLFPTENNNNNNKKKKKKKRMTMAKSPFFQHRQGRGPCSSRP